jgi:hypothetical protein
MIGSDDAVVRSAPGDFHGRPTLRIANGAILVEMLAAAGPRIVGLQRVGATANLFAETPDLGWDTALGRYELLGGHRLWLAPEDSEHAAIPDSDGLAVETLVDGARLTGSEESPTGCVRSIEVRLDPVLPSLCVLHRVHNRGPHPIELAPWSITQLPLGGQALLPMRRAIPGHDTRPNRALVLWPYTSLDDPRLHIRDGLVTVDAVAGDDLKVGCADDTGWVAYLRDGTAIVRRFAPVPDEAHADLGCTVETFCGSRFIELEVLGPMRVLAPGASTSLLEHWEVRDVPTGGPLDVRDGLARPMDGAATW